jgi:glycosyltransferase involved in cell wall biosynthesis
MNLNINGTALRRTSLGGKRYCQGIIEALNWDDRVTVLDLPRWLRVERIDEMFFRGQPDAIFWSPNQRGPLFVRNHVVTVLDCINVEYTYANDWRLPLLRKLSQAVLDNAVWVVAISKATKNAILRNYSIDPAKIIVIAGPVNFHLTDRDTARLPIVSSSIEEFVLMITNSLPHKNTLRGSLAFAASSAARRGISLRIVGSIDPEGRAACLAAGVSVETVTNIHDDVLRDWFEKCKFLFSPSLDEGLNLPIAEALMSGGNVVCSDIAVHREFYDGQVTFFAPYEIPTITDVLNEAFEKPQLSNKCSNIAVGPSFHDVASQYRSLFSRFN